MRLATIERLEQIGRTAYRTGKPCTRPSRLTVKQFAAWRHGWQQERDGRWTR
jgi:hypothetical protein